MSDHPKKHKSADDIPAVVALRAKFDSIDEVTLPAMEEAIAQANTVLSCPPSVDTIPMPAPPMIGTWKIVIEGQGPHHNRSASDADRLVGKFVRELRAAGQKIVHAIFANGSEETVRDDEPEGTP